ncbi:cell wall hydrolase [Asticcacaulis sp. BYS171W]|uniref:Cell wall hydrolase n=1 Tax=Asticcacaulis aquaticus TaxID=2984212 RepID=A0ABT5HYD5_9CAUL|nr:cell wall hydrolase [Asticcacaulis aquaticus]MDC7685097.1 cell wall hydrolase [Asticcacaulis aquaticus]
MRLLTAAGGSGLMLGAACGAVWLGGSLTRDAQLREQAESLMSVNDHSYGADHFRSLNGAQRIAATQDDLDRRAIALVMRHESYTSPVATMRIRQDAQRSSLFASLMKPVEARKAQMQKGQAGEAPVARAGLDLGLMRHNPFAKANPATPFEMKNRSASDLDCLTQAVYYEARGETDAGQRAVAQVILNRVRHPGYPKTICNVVYQGAVKRTGCQFSFTCNGIMANRVEGWAWKRARTVAEDALDGYVMKPVGASTHFHVLSVSPDWAPRMDKTATIGSHVFYQFRGRGSTTLSAENVRPSDAPTERDTPADKVQAVTAATPDANIVTRDAAAKDAVKDAATKVVALETTIKGDDAHQIAQTLQNSALQNSALRSKPGVAPIKN